MLLSRTGPLICGNWHQCRRFSLQIDWNECPQSGIFMVLRNLENPETRQSFCVTWPKMVCGLSECPFVASWERRLLWHLITLAGIFQPDILIFCIMVTPPRERNCSTHNSRPFRINTEPRWSLKSVLPSPPNRAILAWCHILWYELQWRWIDWDEWEMAALNFLIPPSKGFPAYFKQCKSFLSFFCWTKAGQNNSLACSLMIMGKCNWRGRLVLSSGVSWADSFASR